MDIIVNWDSSVASAPAAFKSAIEYVVTLYDAMFTNSETITIGVGYGEVGGTPLAVTAASESISELVPTPVSTSLGLADISTAEYKAIGGTPSASLDGYVGFSSAGLFDFSNINTAAPGQYDIMAAAEHEISEVMGRTSTLGSSGAPSVLDDLRYSSPGTLATASSTIAYFSLDDGTTDLGNYNTSSGEDQGDWSSTGTLSTDAYAAIGTPGTIETLSSSDLLLMNMLGYVYNQNIANAAITQNPALNNWLIGSATNFAGLGGADLFLLSANDQLGYAEFDITGASLATVWFTWQSDGSASPENNAFRLDASSLVTGTGTNALGYGGRDVTVATGYGTGPVATYEFTSSGAVYVGGHALFSGSGDTVYGVIGVSIEVTSGTGNNIAMSSGVLTIDTAVGGTNLIGSNNTVDFAGATYLGLIAGIGNTVNNSIAGCMVNLTSNTSATINGSGGYFGICGTGVSVAASGESGATIGGASFNLYGSYNVVSLGANAYLGLIGGTGNWIGNDVAGASVNLTSNASATIQGSGGYFGICGTNISVTASGEDAATINGASFSLSGGGNAIALGTGTTVDLLGGSGYNTLVGIGGIIQTVGGVSINVAGGNGAITLGGTGGSTLGLLDGSGWTVSGSGDTILTLSNTALSLNPGNGSDIIGLGTNSQLDFTGGSANIGFITGSQDSLAIVASANAQEVLGFNAANGDKIDLSQILAGTSATIASLSDYVSVSPSGTGTLLTIAGAHGSDMIALAGVGSLSLSSLLGTNAFILPPH